MAKQAVKVGLLLHRQGPSGLWAPSCEASAILAASEINGAGGILNRPIELVLADIGYTDRSAHQSALAIVEIEEVSAVVGIMTSPARAEVTNAIGGRVPFVYTPQYEGDETDERVVAVGETSADLLRPSLAWLSEFKRTSRFFQVGNDYLWPMKSMIRARDQIARLGGSIVGEALIPFGFEDYGPLLDRIRQARPHVVLCWLLGHEAVTFNRAFAAAGLAPHILRFSSAIDETVLLGIGADAAENIYVASAYFSSLRSRNNQSFLERYHGQFGETPPPANGLGESVYEGLHCLAGLAEAAGTLRLKELRKNVGRARQAMTARGVDKVAVVGEVHPVYIAAADGHDFRLITTA